MRERIMAGPLTATLRNCWVLASNRRMSKQSPWFGVPQIHAIVVESIVVEEAHRREGHLSRFLARLCSDDRFEMVVIEAIQNPILAEALLRRGWEYDPGVMDFYHVRTKE